MSSLALATPAPAVPPATTETVDNDVMLAVRGVSKHYKLWTSPTERLRYSVLSQAHRSLRTVLPKESAPLAALRRRRDALHRDFTALEELSLRGAARREPWASSGATVRARARCCKSSPGPCAPARAGWTPTGASPRCWNWAAASTWSTPGARTFFLNASILGLTKEETNAKFDDIVAFADIGQFLDQPVKTYSSGMVLRLAFAVSINVEPDILIVDEALAVGDVFFTQKCFQRAARDHRMRGRRSLFVSHSMAAVQNLCSRAILLKDGRAIFEGPPEEAASRYYAACAGGTREAEGFNPAQIITTSLEEASDNRRLREEVLAHDILPAARSRTTPAGGGNWRSPPRPSSTSAASTC